MLYYLELIKTSLFWDKHNKKAASFEAAFTLL